MLTIDHIVEKYRSLGSEATFAANLRRLGATVAMIEAALKAVPPVPTPTPAERRRSFRVIQGDLFE